MTEPKCYSYIRFSTPEQRRGDSLRRQTDAAEQWAKENGYVLDTTLNMQDLGLSGFSGEHRAKGALGKFLALAKGGHIVPGSVLVVENLDRLSREAALDALGLFTDIIKRGIKIVTIADRQEYTRETINANMGQLMMSVVILSRGHEESLIKSKRLRSAWSNKRANIHKKKLTAQCPAWLRLSEDRTKFHVIPERSKAIQQIFEMKLAGIGVNSIIKTMNSEGGWCPPGRISLKNGRINSPGWRESYVRKILRTPAVLGEFQPRLRIKDTPDHSARMVDEGEPIKDYYPRIITDELFNAVQEKMRQNQGKGGRTGKINNLFSHMARCGYCGAPMQFINKGTPPRGGQFLSCDVARRGAGCVKHPVRYPEFENSIIDFCQGLNVGDVLPTTSKATETLTRIRTRLDSVRGKLSANEKKASNLEAAIDLTSDRKLLERHNSRLSAILDEQAALAEEEKELAASIKRLSTSQQATQAQLEDLRAAINSKDAKGYRLALRERLRSLVTEITVYPAGIKRRLFHDLAQQADPATAKKIAAQLERGGYDDREQRAFVVKFATGNWQKIEPGKPGSLTAEYDAASKTTVSFEWGPDGVPVVNVGPGQVAETKAKKYAPKRHKEVNPRA